VTGVQTCALPISANRHAGDERDAERTALVEALAAEGSLIQPETGEPSVNAVVASAYEFAAATSCDLALVQADDLAGMRTGVNLPGTDTERPNWRLRLPIPVETLLSGVTAQTILDRVRGKRS
jgi:glycogen operon protein